VKDLSKRAKEIIELIPYVTIASVSKDGMPWNSPVFTAYDKEYCFYWGTYRESQKAINIRANNNVFLVVYDSSVPPGTGEGVYMKATAIPMTEPDEIKQAYNILKSRHAMSFWDFEAVGPKGPVQLFKATPQKVWMNDDDTKDGHYIDTRTAIDL